MVLLAPPEPAVEISTAGRTASVKQSQYSQTSQRASTFQSTCDEIEEHLDSVQPVYDSNNPADLTKRSAESRWRGEKSETFRCDSTYAESDTRPPRDFVTSKRLRRRRKQTAMCLLAAAAAVGLVALVWHHTIKAGTQPWKTGRKDAAASRNADETIEPLAAPQPVAPANSAESAEPVDPAPLEQEPSVKEPAWLGHTPAIKPAVHMSAAGTGNEANQLPDVGVRVATANAHTPPIPPAASPKPEPPKALDHFADIFANKSGAPVPSTGQPTNPPGDSPTPLPLQRPRRQFQRTLLPLELPRDLAAVSNPVHRVKRVPLKPIESEDKLKQPLTHLSMNVGMDETLKFVTGISGVPFTVRPDALRYSRIAPDVPIPIEVSKSTVGDALRIGLKRRGLDYRIVDGHAIIDRVGTFEATLQTNKHQVRDLLTSGVTDGELANLVRQLILPISWNAIENRPSVYVESGFLVLTHQKTAHSQTNLMLQKLRLARGMPAQGSWDRNELRDDWEFARGLTKPIALRTKGQDSLGSVIATLDQLAGVETSILADWAAIAKVGLDPLSPLKVSVPRQPLSTALPAILKPEGLTFRCVGPQMIEITTPAALRTHSELAVHSIGHLVQAGYDSNLVIEQIEATIGPANFRRHGGFASVVYHDGAQSLLVSTSQVEQRAIHWIIDELERRL